MKKSFAWSYSALTRYENCPKQYYHLNLMKDYKDADSDFAADGKVIHDALKSRVVDGKPLPIPLRHLEKMAAKFADAPGDKHGEMKLALNRDFEPVDFFDRTTFVRVVIDLTIVDKKTAVIIDWKTGKPKEDFTQLGLCAGVLSRWMPEIDLFKTAFVWTKHSKISPRAYTLSKLPELWDSLLKRVAKLEEAITLTEFPAKPSGLCGYCPITSCPHHAPRG